MPNAVMCSLSLYDVIRITRYLHIKLKSFSYIAKKSLIMSEAFLVYVSIYIEWSLIKISAKYSISFSEGNFVIANSAGPDQMPHYSSGSSLFAKVPV